MRLFSPYFSRFPGGRFFLPVGGVSTRDRASNPRGAMPAMRFDASWHRSRGRRRARGRASRRPREETQRASPPFFSCGAGLANRVRAILKNNDQTCVTPET